MRNACMESIYKMAQEDKRVVFIASDVSPDLLKDMREEIPERYFMEGISEANIVGAAAGLAMEGYIPYVAAIGTFLTRRCYEQVALDVCLHNLPVRFVSIGCGLNYASLGPTHQAIEDITIMRALPNMKVVVPSDADEMKRLMPKTLDDPSPIYIRMAKGFDPIISKEENGFEIGQAILMREAQAKGKKVLIVSTGIMTTQSLEAAESLSKNDIECTVLHLHTVKPLDMDAICKHSQNKDLIVTLEEHTIVGGFGSAVLEGLSDCRGLSNFPRVYRFGLMDKFCDDYGTQKTLMKKYGLQPEDIERRILNILSKTEGK